MHLLQKSKGIMQSHILKAKALNDNYCIHTQTCKQAIRQTGRNARANMHTCSWRHGTRSEMVACSQGSTA